MNNMDKLALSFLLVVLCVFVVIMNGKQHHLYAVCFWVIVTIVASVNFVRLKIKLSRKGL